MLRRLLTKTEVVAVGVHFRRRMVVLGPPAPPEVQVVMATETVAMGISTHRQQTQKTDLLQAAEVVAATLRAAMVRTA